VSLCVCGSGRPYAGCCGALHLDGKNALTAEALMRSGRGHRLHEVSNFVREDGRWFYVDGVVNGA